MVSRNTQDYRLYVIDTALTIRFQEYIIIGSISDI